VQASRQTKTSDPSILDRDIFLCSRCDTKCITKGNLFLCGKCGFTANIISCKCQCGETLLHKNSWGRPRQFFGRRFSLSIREKMRLVHQGKKHSADSIIKMRLASLGDKRYNWKGDDVSRVGLHQWVRSQIPEPDLCEICNKVPPYDLAKVTGVYKKDFCNWKYMCRSCHQKFDVDNGTRRYTRKNFGQVCNCGSSYVVRHGLRHIISLHITMLQMYVL
jgi:hypothetical protein